MMTPDPPTSAAISYRGRVRLVRVAGVLPDEARSAVEAFLQAWDNGTRRSRARLGSKVAIAEMQSAALHHGDPWVRRSCLGFLDHHAADKSAAIFMAALDDPVAPVRDLAMHGLACEQCRTEDLCVTDVTPKITRVLDRDPNAEMRYKALSILRRLADRDPAAIAAMQRAAEGDPDDRVREAATAILAGNRPRRWNQFRRSDQSRAEREGDTALRAATVVLQRRSLTSREVLLTIVGLGVSQRPQTARQLGQQERVLAVDVEVVADKRRQPGDVFVGDRLALRS